MVWIVLGLNTAMFLVKLSVAYLSGSRSLLADSFQSFANLFISGAVLASLKIAEWGPDEKHPYGYGKMEFLASAVVSLLLLLGAKCFLVFTIWEMATAAGEALPNLIAVGAAVVSIIGNQFAYRYGRCAGERLRSAAILANAKVNQADVWTSWAVIVAVIGANLGWPSLDHIVSIVISLLVARMALFELKDSVKRLMDYSPGSETSRIKRLARNIEGLIEVRDIKTRLVGRNLWVDLEACVRGDLPIAEGLKISRELKAVLIRNITEVAEVSVRLRPRPEGGN